MLVRLALLGFLVLPLVEIALFIVVGQAIGVGPTLLLVLAETVLGTLIIRHRGMRLLAEARTTMGQGQLPARALADAMLVSIAGALLIVPGFFTDLLALPLLIPPLRSAIYRFLGRRMTVVTAAPSGPSPTGPRTIELDDEHFRTR